MVATEDDSLDAVSAGADVELRPDRSEFSDASPSSSKSLFSCWRIGKDAVLTRLVTTISVEISERMSGGSARR